MPDLNTLRIVHLEDEMTLRDIVRTTIMVLDPQTEVRQFEGSDETLRYVEQDDHRQKIDLFLLDVRVPGELDGIGVAFRLRDLGCQGMIAFTSAYAAPDTKTIASLDYVWLSKPVELNRMRSVLKLARSRRQSSAERNSAPAAPPTPTLPPESAAANASPTSNPPAQDSDAKNGVPTNAIP